MLSNTKCSRKQLIGFVVTATVPVQYTNSGMDVEGHSDQQHQRKGASPMSKRLKLTLEVLSIALFTVGISGGTLLLLLYFRKGGKRQWLNSWLQNAGWPILVLPLLATYLRRRRRRRPDQPPAKLFFLTPRLFAACTAIGLLVGLDCFLYVYGLVFVPVSTGMLLLSSQLAFMAFFAFLLVRQKFTPYSINSVGLMIMGAVLLGIHANSDRPDGVSKGEYLKGFFLALGAAALYGLVLPLIELTYAKAEQAITYTLVMEMQLVMGFFATFFCTLGMIVNKDFQAIPTEARNYELGEVRYYMVLVGTAVMWQLYSLGAIGVIFTVHALLTGILVAAFIPITQILSVLLFHEKFSSDKGLALVFSLWGLASYFYGEYKKHKKQQRLRREEPSNS